MSTGPRAVPERVDPRRLAASGGRLEGEMGLNGMPRLGEFLLADEGPAADTAWLCVDFGEDDQRRVTIDGHLSARLRLECQWCLQALDWPLEVAIQLTAVADEDAAAQVPREREPLLLDGTDLVTADWVEDELLLALPPVARCGDFACPRRPALLGSGGETRKPFAALEQLKRDRQE